MLRDRPDQWIEELNVEGDAALEQEIQQPLFVVRQRKVDGWQSPCLRQSHRSIDVPPGLERLFEGRYVLLQQQAEDRICMRTGGWVIHRSVAEHLSVGAARYKICMNGDQRGWRIGRMRQNAGLR